MDSLIHCNACLSKYHEETCVPKVLKCGHSVCAKCLASILDTQGRKKRCPKCKASVLMPNINQYPTNFDLLCIAKSSDVKSCSDFLEVCTLESMKTELNSQKKILKKLMEERDSFTYSLNRNTESLENNKASLRKLLTYTQKLYEADNITDVVQDIEECLENVDMSLDLWESRLLSLNDYENSKQFLKEIIRRLQSGNCVYACTRIELEEWKFGKVTFSEGENRLNIHCLSSSGYETGASLVLLSDLKDCVRIEELLTFFEIGSQKLSFIFKRDSSVDLLRCIKFCTGEDGVTVKGLSAYACGIRCIGYHLDIPNRKPIKGYEDAIHRKSFFQSVAGEVMLECGLHWISFTQQPRSLCLFNVVGKLDEKCKIDFNKIGLEKKVTDCGISLQL